MRLSALPAAIVVASFSCAVPASALDRHDIQGIWRHPDTGSLIQIYACGGGICAKVASTADPNLKDVKNPDPALRNRPVAGVVLWERPKESGDLQWIGSAYNTADGGTYYGTMHLVSPTTLAISACNLSVMTCADQTWTKADPQTAKAVVTPIFQPKTAPAAPNTIVEVSQPKTVPAAPKPVVEVSQPKAVPAAPKPVVEVSQPKAAPAAPKPVVEVSQPKAAPAAPKPVVEKPKRPPVKVAEKPKAPPPPPVVEEKPKEVPESRPERPRDPYGYDELPHIHPIR